MIVRTGLLRLMVCGYGAAAGPSLRLTIASWLIGLVAAFSAGVALGLTVPAINLLVAQINPERPAAAVNILNFAWAIGAVAGPPVIAFFGRDGHLTRPLVGLAVLLSSVAFLTARRGIVDSAFASDDRPKGREDRTRFVRICPTRMGNSLCAVDRRADLHLRGNGNSHQRMDRHLCVTSWRVEQRT